MCNGRYERAHSKQVLCFGRGGLRADGWIGEQGWIGGQQWKSVLFATIGVLTMFPCCKLTTVVAYSNSVVIHLLLSCYNRILIVLIGKCVNYYYHVCWLFPSDWKFANTESIFLVCAYVCINVLVCFQFCVYMKPEISFFTHTMTCVYISHFCTHTLLLIPLLNILVACSDIVR